MVAVAQCGTTVDQAIRRGQPGEIPILAPRVLLHGVVVSRLSGVLAAQADSVVEVLAAAVTQVAVDLVVEAVVVAEDINLPDFREKENQSSYEKNLGAFALQWLIV